MACARKNKIKIDVVILLAHRMHSCWAVYTCSRTALAHRCQTATLQGERTIFTSNRNNLGAQNDISAHLIQVATPSQRKTQ
jgi:hypothetical protein